eukprot:g12470.t1
MPRATGAPGRVVFRPQTRSSSALTSLLSGGDDVLQDTQKWTSHDDSSAAAYMRAESRGTGTVYKTRLKESNVDLYIGKACKMSMSATKPGNGGLRIQRYGSTDQAATEALALAQGMAVKHGMFNTGFSGTKMVVDTSNIGGIENLNRSVFLQETTKVLNNFHGLKYTGCDINSTLDDMECMGGQTDYILAGLGNKNVDPNDATAYGVVGSIIGAVGEKDLKDLRLVVHGCGNVGSTVAKLLLRAGATVYTIDKFSPRANIGTAINLSHEVSNNGDLTTSLPEHDVFVPCSSSRLIDEKIARYLASSSTQIIVGATNLPFSSPVAENTFLQNGKMFIPEGISSAGAVIVDSIEHHDIETFAAADPQDIYEFVKDVVAKKTRKAIALSKSTDNTISAVLPDMLASSESDATSLAPLGCQFKYWAAYQDEKKVYAVYDNIYRAISAQSKTQQNVNYAAARSFSSNASSSGVYDVAIAGAGIMGLSIAYQLKRSYPDLKVVVCERENALGHGSSGWSTGFLRAYYSFDETMQLALDGINAYKNWSDYTELGNETEAFFTETGALWMLGKSSLENQAMQTRLESFGVESVVMDEHHVSHVFPALSTLAYPKIDYETGEIVQDDFGTFSSLFEAGCGHMDSSACLRDMQKACERVGVEIRMGCGVERLLGGSMPKIDGFELQNGEQIQAGATINCLGPWFDKLNNAFTDADTSTGAVKTSTVMLPTRIQVGHKALPDDEKFLSLPFVADGWGESGIYFMPRRGNKQLVFGSVAHRFESEIVEDPDNYNTALDPDVKQDYLNCLHHRLPDLPSSGQIQGFSHMYTVNQDDVHPVIGPSAEFDNYYLCNGFSGHGFKLAPAVGSLMTRQIMGSVNDDRGYQTSIPSRFMDPNRQPLTLQVKTHFA